MNIKIFLGGFATVLTFINYIPYFRDIFKGKTKPHTFSWFIWGILAAEAWVIQVKSNAGPGAWVSGAILIVVIAVLILSFRVGRQNITKFDWIIFIGALLTFIPWFFTSNLVISVILIIVIDILGFIPTIRKSYLDPYSETALTFTLNGFRYLITIFALYNYSIETALYPVYWMLTNWGFAAMLWIRRKHYDKVVQEG